MNTTLRSAQSYKRATQAGVTLIEVMIVVAIMAMLAGGVAFAVIPQYQKSQIKSAEAACFTLRQAVQSWQMTNNESGCPSMSDLISGKHIDSATNTKDPWSGEYQLTCPDGEVVVSSGGPDKKRGTSDDISVPKAGGAPSGT